MTDDKRQRREEAVERLSTKTGRKLEARQCFEHSHAHPRIAQRLDGELVHMIGRWEELPDTYFIVDSPYEPVPTFSFLEALDAVGEIPIPEHVLEQGVVLICDERRESPYSRSLDTVNDKMRHYQQSPERYEVVLNLNQMKMEGTITDEPVDLPMNEEATVIVWKGDNGQNELLEVYKRYCCLCDIHKQLKYAFNDGTSRSQHSVFLTTGDPTDHRRHLPRIIARGFIEALAMDAIDVGDVVSLYNEKPIEREKLDVLLGMLADWRSVPELVEISAKVSAIIELWQYAMKQEGLRATVCSDEVRNGTLPKRLARIGELIGVDEMMRTYMSGVPVSDITA